MRELIGMSESVYASMFPNRLLRQCHGRPHPQRRSHPLLRCYRRRQHGRERFRRDSGAARFEVGASRDQRPDHVNLPIAGCRRQRRLGGFDRVVGRPTGGEQNPGNLAGSVMVGQSTITGNTETIQNRVIAEVGADRLVGQRRVRLDEVARAS